jgi:hypothetical protein
MNSWIVSDEPLEVGFSCRLLLMERSCYDGLPDRVIFSQMQFCLELFINVVRVVRKCGAVA